MTSRLRVPLVEDLADIRRTTSLALDHAGFDVVEAATGAEVERVLGQPFDVVLLDRGLPDADGITLIPAIRSAAPRAHIIIVSGSGAETDRVEGLLAGADDYVVKPASMPELIARMTAAGRRLERDRGEVLRFDDLVIDIDRRLVVRNGVRVDLTRQEFDLLSHLARNSERAVSRQELLVAAWSSSAEWQSPATVTEHVRRVRNKVEDDPSHPRWIESVRGVGYRFNSTAGAGASRIAPRTPIVLIDGSHVAHASPDALSLLAAERPEQVVGREVADFVAPRSIAALKARRAMAEAGSWPRPEIVTLVRCDGREIHVEVSTTPATWEGRSVRQVTLWPIEGRTNRLRELVTGIGVDVPDAVIITDTEMRIESFNDAAERLYGWREEEILGQPVMEVIPWLGDPEEVTEATVALERNHRWHGRVRQRRSDGRPVEVMASTTLLSDEAGRTVGVISVNRPARDAVVHRDGSRHDREITDQISVGIEREEFDVFYQPIVRLDDRRIAGIEALVRWRHPERGLLAPGAFIHSAERTGVIADLGRYVLRRSCAQVDRWRRDGHDVHLAVNLSARQIAEPDLVDDVGRAIADFHVEPGVLWLEVTESALVEDLDLATKKLDALRGLGVGISIDDFGTGWASLTYLHQFPVDALKIDSVFVKGLESRASATAIVRSIVSLGQELDIAVIAEGIETEHQLEALRALGCIVGQGFLFAEPRPADEVQLGVLETFR